MDQQAAGTLGFVTFGSSGSKMEWLVRSMAILILLLTIPVIFLGAKYDVSYILYNLQQMFSGSYGDKFCIAICTAMISTLVARYFNLELGLFSLGPGLFLQNFAKDFMLSPMHLTQGTGFLALSSTKRELKRQQLVLLGFLTAQCLRFTGFEYETRSWKARLTSRFWEFIIYAWLPKCEFLSSWRVLLPSMILVSAARTNEVFRIWRLESDSAQSADHKEAYEMFKRVDSLLTRTPVSRIPWPNAQQCHGFQDTRFDILNDSLGIFQHLSNFNDVYFFLWVKGSGLPVLLAYNAVVTVFLCSRRMLPPEVLFVGAVALLFLNLQCLPGFVGRLDAAIELLTSDDPGLDVQALRRQILQYEWFNELWKFFGVLKKEGHPQHFRNHTSFWSRFLNLLEACELMFHVVIFAVARIIVRACLLGMAILLKTAIKITNSGAFVKWIWCKSSPVLAFVAVRLTAPDIHTTTRRITEAEAALDSRKLCSTCIETVDVRMLLENFKNGAGYSVDQCKRGALEIALCNLACAAVLEAACATNSCKITQRLQELLPLIRLYHKSIFEISSHDAEVETLHKGLDDQLKIFSLARYKDGYKQTTVCGCVAESDWSIMKAQLCVSMLIKAHDVLREGELKIISYAAAAVWIKKRKECLDCKVDLVSSIAQP